MLRAARSLAFISILAAPLASGCGGKNPSPDGTRRPGDQAGPGTAGSGTANVGSGGVTNVGNGQTNR